MRKAPFQRLKEFIEAGARNSKVDSSRIQAMHDTSVDLGATCSAMSEAADFSSNDVMALLTKALRVQFKEKYPYAYIADMYDDSIVFSVGYNSDYYRADYDVNEAGNVTLGTPKNVIRKVQYIDAPDPNASKTGDLDPVLNTESVTDVEINGDVVALVESNINLSEATRMVKLIAPGWGSSGYYAPEVLKRDGPQVFRKGLHNFWDHPTALEEKERPEGSLSKVASVLVEDAVWKDDHNGNGPGLYAKAKINTQYEKAIDDLAGNIGMSIRANGKARIGEADGKKGNIIEAITNARSVDYVTIPGAGGKVLELFESAKQPVTIIESNKEITNMAVNDGDYTKLTETIAAFNRKMITNEARDHARNTLAELRVKESIRTRIMMTVMNDLPLNESGELDIAKFDEKIKAAVEAELSYLTSVGALGKITGFGESKSTNNDKEDVDALFKQFNESIAALDS